MCYATVGMVTDYDCWHDDHDNVTVDTVLKVLIENASDAKSLLKAVAPLINSREKRCDRSCHNALDGAIITGPEARDSDMAEKLQWVAGRVLEV